MKPEISEFASECWEEHKDVAAAVEAGLEKIESDAGLCAEWSAELRRLAFEDLVRSRMRSSRTVMMDRCGQSSDRRAALLESGRLNLLSLPLPGGKPLGDAIRSEVEDGAASYRKQAMAELRNAAFLSVVARRLRHPLTKVKSVWDNEALLQAFDAATAGEEAA